MRMSPGSSLGRTNVLAFKALSRSSRDIKFTTQSAKGFGELLQRSPKKKERRNEKGNDSAQPAQSSRLKPRQISPILSVPDHIPRPSYVGTGEMPWGKSPEIHDAEGVEKMRAACQLAARVLKYAGTLVRPGQTTDFIDQRVHKMIIENGAYPSPLTYGRFPKSVCTSVNECICHGIPDQRQLVEGDIVNIDVTVYLNGYHGDTSTMFYVGKPSDRAKWLCEITREALYEGIKQCGPGAPVNAIGKAIHSLADRHRVQICPDFVGHGVGRHFHANPLVVAARNGSRDKLQVGQTFTIEPIFVDGNPKWNQWRDGWTIVTKDGSWTAQHEHTILITDHGHEILTELSE